MKRVPSMRLYMNLELSALHSRRYVVRKDFNVLGYVVPKGFLTNGADIPKILYPWMPPNDPVVEPAVTLHDYLCDVSKVNFNRDRNIGEALRCFQLADTKLREAMLALEINPLRVSVYYLGVSLYTKCIRPISLWYHKKYDKDLYIYKRNIRLINQQIS